ncbi:hypothetical protein B0H19DRAFT_940572, partial [Mycena capillaripes]
SSNGYAFMAIVIHYIGNDGRLGMYYPGTLYACCLTFFAEECLIDFQELLGAHSGENMADAVWKTVDKFGLRRRVSVFS